MKTACILGWLALFRLRTNFARIRSSRVLLPRRQSGFGFGSSHSFASEEEPTRSLTQFSPNATVQTLVGLTNCLGVLRRLHPAALLVQTCEMTFDRRRETGRSSIGRSPEAPPPWSPSSLFFFLLKEKAHPSTSSAPIKKSWKKSFYNLPAKRCSDISLFWLKIKEIFSH